MASFTGKDSRDANRAINGHYLLHRLNVAANLTPQILSHVVVEIFPAHPKVDFRFSREYADHAILVSLKWHDSGKGCMNSSCYPTYPTGKVCDLTTPPTVFMTGKNVGVVACQPACYARQRQKELLKRAKQYAEQSVFTDNANPSRCVECDFVNPLVTDHIVRRKIDKSYDLWDGKTRKQVSPPFPVGFHLTEAADTEDHTPKLDTDLQTFNWNPREKRCEVYAQTLLRQIAEPYWRDPSHSVCRLTNFSQGESVVKPYYGEKARYTQEHVKKLNPLGFLQANTETYCRAFGKELDEKTGDCEYTWWEQALTYTIFGEGILRLVRNLVLPNSGCNSEYWQPTLEEVGGHEIDPFSARTFRQWRADVNQSFVIPPPNISLLDLGIDPLVTGNRLYWNNFEGIISHLPMFRTVEMLSDGQKTGTFSTGENTDWRDVYWNYNENADKNSTGIYGPLSKDEASVAFQPYADSVLSERVLDMFGAMGESTAPQTRSSDASFNEEDVKQLIDRINEMTDSAHIFRIFKELGIQVGVEVIRSQVGKLLKKSIQKILQFSVKALAGRGAAALMRVGLRVGTARIIGSVMSQLTSKLILAGSSAATGIGIVVSIIELLSFVIDVAILCGWDPGHYKSYTSAASFRPLMDGYFYSLVSQNALSIPPEVIINTLLATTTDKTDADKSGSNGNGTADATPRTNNDGSPVEPSFSGESSIDLRVNVPRWFNNRWSRCFETDNAKLSEIDPRTSALKSSSGFRTKLLTPRLAMENDEMLWAQFNAFQFLGTLRTNSYGQLVNLPEQEKEFDDDTVASLMQEMDYRDLTTMSTLRSVDNRSYNSKIRTARAIGGVLIGVGSVMVISIAAMTVTERSRLAAQFLWMNVLLVLIGLAAIAISCWNLHVIDDPYVRTMKRLDASNTTNDGTNKDPAKPDLKLSDFIDTATKARSLAALFSGLYRTTAAE